MARHGYRINVTPGCTDSSWSLRTVAGRRAGATTGTGWHRVSSALVASMDAFATKAIILVCRFVWSAITLRFSLIEVRVLPNQAKNATFMAQAMIAIRLPIISVFLLPSPGLTIRSEERRVGKE